MSLNYKESPADNIASSFVSKIQQHPSTPTNMNEDTMHDKNTTPTTSSSTNMLAFRSSTLLAGDMKIDSESSDVNSIMESDGNKKNPSIEKEEEENSNIKFVDARKSPSTANADNVDNDTSNSSPSDNNDNSESEEESDTSLSTPTGFPSPSLLGAPTSPLANTLTTTISGRPSTGSPRPSTPPMLLFSSSSGGENDPKKIKNIEEHTNLLPPLSIHNNNNGGGGSPTKMSPTKPTTQSQQESHHKQEKQQQQGDTMFSLLPNFLRPFSNNINDNNKDDEAVISQVPSSESENNNHQQNYNYNYNDNKQVFQSQLEFLSDETSEFLAIPSLQKNNNKNKKGDAVSAAKNASIFRSGNHNNNNNNTDDEGTTAHHLHSSPENEAIRLNVQASDLLSRGKNEEALSMYRKAIRISKKDLASINSEIKELTSSTNKNNKTHQQSHQVRYSPTYFTKQQAPPPSFLSSHGSFDSMVTVQHSNRQRDEELKAKRIEIASTIADTLNNMGVVYEMNDNYDEALKSCKEALRVYNEMCQREYNNNNDSSLSNDDEDETKKNDPDIERTIRNIALIERAKESYPERQKLRSQAEEKLRMVESSLIHDSPHLPYPSSSQQQQQEPAMGSLHPYQKQQLLREAFNIYIEAFNLEREWLGASHPTTARTLQLIGNIRWRLIQNNNGGGVANNNNNVGNMSVQDTTRDLSQAAKILEIALGPIHPHVINALLDLAALKDLLGDTQSALTLYQKALTSQKTSFGEAHQDIGTTLNNIGVIYFNLEEYDKALATYKEAISTYMAISESNSNSNQEGGEEIIIHPDTALVWNNIGELHKLRKDWGQASRALEESLKILAETSGSGVDNSKYVDTLINTAEMNLKAKKINKALLMYEQAYAVQCNNNTNNDLLEIAKTLDHLAHVQKLKGLFRDSQQSLTKALEIRRQELGDTQHVEIAKTLVKLGTLQIQMRKNQDAIIVLTESLRLFDINDVSEHHPMVKDARRKRDAVCLSLHQHTSEIMWMKKLNKKWEKNSNIHSTKNYNHNNFSSSSSSPLSQSSSLPDLFDTQAISMKHRGDWDGAMKEYQKALKLRRETLGYSHLQVGQTLFNIAALHKRKDEFSESMILYKEVLRLCTLNKLPKNHPFVKEVNNEIHNLS